MTKPFRLATVALALAVSSPALAQLVPVMVEDAAKAGWEYGAGSGLSPMTESEELYCSAKWMLWEEALNYDTFDQDILSTFPDEMGKAATVARRQAWVARMSKWWKTSQPEAFNAIEDAAYDQEDMLEDAELAAAGDPEKMFSLATNLATCLVPSRKPDRD